VSRPRCQIVETHFALVVAGLTDATGDSHDIAPPGDRQSDSGMEVHMSIIAWLVLGAIAGYLAGFLVKGDEGLGVIGHIVLGIVGAVVGGFLASVLFNTKPIDGPLDLSSIVVATIGAIITVVVVSAVSGGSRSGRGAI
jgi:uncharacterized membrane protein YeaQ/YmgE (transglycosylase-associated protein family)